MLLGEAGNDALTGGTGFDLLLGGLNADKLNSGPQGNAILIGGTTAHDPDDLALLAILSEWARKVDNVPLSIDDRIAHLLGTLAGGLNGGDLLKTPDTVFNDGSTDALTGFGNSWFFQVADASVKTTDTIKGKVTSDRVQQ